MSQIKENMSKIDDNFSLNDHLIANYTCGHCEFTTDSGRDMADHSTVHNLPRRPFLSNDDNCGQTFKRKHSMRRHHKRAHPKERHFICNVCDKRFTQSDGLKQHLFLHSDDNSSKCPMSGCKQVFQSHRYLKTHLKRRHKNLKNNSKTSSPENISQEMPTLELMPNERPVVISLAKKKPTKTIEVTTDVANDDSKPQKLFKCQVISCGQTFQLERSLRSHYKFSHSDQYNSTTKTVVMTKTMEMKTKNDNNNSCDYEPNVNTSENNGFDHEYNDWARVDVQSIDKISVNTFQYECNLCYYKTKSFDRIADHFDNHWQQLYL